MEIQYNNQQQVSQTKHLTIISANLRGFQTNIGDLTHSFILPNKADIVATVETFLNDSIPHNFGRIDGYTNWYRKDRKQDTHGGVAVCFRSNIHVQVIDPEMPEQLELSFFKLWLKSGERVLLCVCYRPQWQGSLPIEYLNNNIDRIMQQYSCDNFILVGDLNQHLVARSFDDLLNIHGLTNHVNFPTHVSGSSLDPVVTDLPENSIKCEALGAAGSSDHYAILTTIHNEPMEDTATTRTIWLWDRANWTEFREALTATNWDFLNSGSIDERVATFTNIIIELMTIYVPNKTYRVKPKDQPWFGYNCRVAADEKSRAWVRYKNNPTQRNRNLHQIAKSNMKDVEAWAKIEYRQSLKRKLTNRNVGTKSWWCLEKKYQGFTTDDSIPPLVREDGSTATSSLDKAELLGSYFANKMKVPAPHQAVPDTPILTNKRLSTLHITEEEVKQLLLKVNVKKAIGPDKVSPHILKKCASQLTPVLTKIFQACLVQQVWPKLWKRASVSAIHKKGSRNSLKNYRPISLLSVLGKLYEKIIVEKMSAFFDDNQLISTKQYGFRKSRSTSDLLLQLTSEWNATLDKREYTYVIALDIAGAFDRVWHKGLTAKLKSLGISGNLLGLIDNYLQNRVLQVALNGQTSEEYHIEASVPQGSVIGPMLWNVFFNDLLQMIPQAFAYADDCTLTFKCTDENRKETIELINDTLNLITIWGNLWQVELAPEKTQVMLITRRQQNPEVELPYLKLNGRILQLEQSISILGVEIDSKLTFTNHISDLAKKCGKKLACLRRVSHLLDSKGCQLLYNAQIRPLMEYAMLSWSSCPQSFLRLLDKIQERAHRIINFKRSQDDPPCSFQTLQHRRDVAGLCVLYKVQVLRIAHLHSLRLPNTVITGHNTRSANNLQHKVIVPFARTEQYKRTFHPYISRCWNLCLQEVNINDHPTMQSFKNRVNRWRSSNPVIT